MPRRAGPTPVYTASVMIPPLATRFGQEIFEGVCRRYGIEPSEIRSIGSFDNVIFEVGWGDRRAILRLSDSFRRSADQVCAELAWIDHLAAGGVAVARPIPSPVGNLAEVIDHPQRGYFTAALFERAPGRHTEDEDITPDFVRAWGATLGRIHALSRDYVAPQPHWNRPDWADDNRVVEGIFPPEEHLARSKYREVVKRLETLPRPPDAYGLIHADAHRGNFFIHRGRPVLFDFDGCITSWFVNDVAIALFYAVLDAPPDRDPDDYGAWLLEHLLDGYRRESELAPHWLEAVPDFLKLRELDTYGLILHHLGEGHEPSPWDAGYMEGRRERILADVPYLNLAWGEWL